ncbi:hypothetical protein TanjilG_32374 [Lupinus angustifolius]|uniref:Uncharacterized protein n=1 Tax=Lupinus angustifolius TaxID=3871 RepID=A0A4P1R1B8_LUPAN|nr:hypothetical protein TanjilG_32374 [Lupinus angustifolius]
MAKHAAWMSPLSLHYDPFAREAPLEGGYSLQGSKSCLERPKEGVGPPYLSRNIISHGSTSTEAVYGL